MAKEYNKIEARNNMKIEKETEKTEEKRVPLQKVVSVEPKKVKKGLLSRLAVGVMGPDGLPGIGTFVAEEIIKPAIKNLIVDSVTSGINKMMYRDGGGPTNRHHGYSPHRGYPQPPQYTNYANRYNASQSSAPQPVQPSESRVPAVRYGVDDYKLTDRNDASHVLISLTENANNYGTVSVADYYDLIGVASAYTDNNYGWSAEGMARATIMPVAGGYIIKFPQVEVIG